MYVKRKTSNDAAGRSYVDDFVTDPNADAADAIEAADDACPRGGELYFGCYKRYLVGRTVNIKRAHHVNYNGSTIAASADLDSAAILHGEWLGTWSSTNGDFAAFAVTKNQTAITLPAGITCAPGDYLQLTSPETSFPGYTHGLGAIVTAVNGTTHYLIRPVYADMTITGIQVWRGYTSMTHINGRLDLTATPNRASFSIGLQLRGTNFYISNMSAFGSDYAGMGIWVDGDTGTVANCSVAGFVNLAGATGGGRIGYGVRADASSCLLDSITAYDCKHGLSTANRSKMADGVTYRNCRVYERTDVNVLGRYSGSMDFHSNVLNASIEGESTEVIGVLRLLSARAPVRVRGGRWVQVYEGGLVETFDVSYQDLDFADMNYQLATQNSSFLRILNVHPAEINTIKNVRLRRLRCINPDTAVGRLIDLQRATGVDGLEIIDCEHAGGSLFRHAGGNLRRLTIKGTRRCQVNEAAVRIVCAGGTDVMEDVTIDDNDISRSNYTGSENLIYAYSSTSTRVTSKNLFVSANKLTHTNDTSTTYSLNLSSLLLDGFTLSRNRVRRGSFRALTIGQSQVTDAQVIGNVLGSDGQLIVHGNPSQTTLDGWVLSANSGNAYTVNTAGGGVVKTRYLAESSQNSFLTFLP